MALSPAGEALLVCEAFHKLILKIAIRVDGSAGDVRTFADDLPGPPIKLALGGPDLCTANLGRGHPTRIATDTNAPPLWQASV